MATSRELERRLQEWADEYAGSKYENIGWSGKSWHYSHIKYHGRAPDGLGDVVTLGTPADKVEECVAELGRSSDGYKPSEALRAEYWMRNAPEEQKLQRLRAKGLPMSRQGYYGYLKQAKFYVAGVLQIRISEEEFERACV